MSEQYLFPFQKERVQIKRKPEFGTPEFRHEYARYITSAKWKRLCQAVRLRAKCQCERCPAISSQLSVHHITYERFQNELLTDLLALCTRCHAIADREREEENRRKFEQAGEDARYAAARKTYLTKKYGEGWDLEHDPENLHEEFDAWIDRKRENEDDD